jgi:GT2 family glycosyltransferase
METVQTTFIIVTRNSKMLMASVLDSIYNQTRRDFQVAVIDNESSDGTVEFVRFNYPQVLVVDNNKNIGFAKANNQGIRMFKTPYLIFCNPDVVLDPNWLEVMMATAEAESNSNFDIFGGKLLKLKVLNSETGDMEKTDVIDSCGLKILKNQRVVELGAGEPAESFTDNREVFGHSGALFMAKRSVLESIILRDKFHQQGDYFDGNFFLYKEDIDLAWRLRLSGHRSLLVADAVAYHLRSASGSEHQGNLAIAKHRNQKSGLSKYYSYRNHWILLLEDSFFVNLIIFSPQIVWMEIKKLIYIVLFETRNIFALVEIIKMLPEVMSKRKAIFKEAKINAKEFREWIG